MAWNRGPWLGQVPLVPGPFQARIRKPFVSGNGPQLAGPVVNLDDATFNQALSAPFAAVDFWSPG